MDPMLLKVAREFGLPLLLAAGVLILARRPWKRGAGVPGWAAAAAPASAFVLGSLLARGWTGWWPRNPDYRLPDVAAGACLLGVAGGLAALAAGKDGAPGRWARRLIRAGVMLGAGAAVAWVLTTHRHRAWAPVQAAGMIGGWAALAAAQWWCADRLVRTLPPLAASLAWSGVAGATGYVLFQSGLASIGQLSGLLGLAFLLVAGACAAWKVAVAPAAAVAGLMLPALWLSGVVFIVGRAEWASLALLGAAMPAACAVAAAGRPSSRALRAVLALAAAAALAGGAAALVAGGEGSDLYGWRGR